MAQTQLKSYVDGLLWLPTTNTVDVDGITRFRDSIVVHNLSEKAKVLLIKAWNDMQEMIDITDDNLNRYYYNKTEDKWVGCSLNTQVEDITLEKFLEDKTKVTVSDTYTFESVDSTITDKVIDLSEVLTSNKQYLFVISFDSDTTTLTRIEYRYYDTNNTTLESVSCRDLTISYYDIFNSNDIYKKLSFTSAVEGNLTYTIDIYEL